MDPPDAAAKIRRFEEQILPHLPDLYRAARRLVGRVDAAEDLVQDTWERPCDTCAEATCAYTRVISNEMR